jgi:DNA-binding YbaB/EbfC family protein
MQKFGMGSILKQAQKMQEQMQKVQEELANVKVEGSAGGGMVTAVATGKQEIVEVKVDPEVVNPDDVEMLEDLIVAAVNQALEKAQDRASEEMGKVTGGVLPDLLPGLKLS